MDIFSSLHDESPIALLHLIAECGDVLRSDLAHDRNGELSPFGELVAAQARQANLDLLASEGTTATDAMAFAGAAQSFLREGVRALIGADAEADPDLAEKAETMFDGAFKCLSRCVATLERVAGVTAADLRLSKSSPTH